MDYEYNGKREWFDSMGENILQELRMLSVESAGKEEISDQDMCEALTVNENLASLGYVLKPADILRLAGSKEPGRIYAILKAYSDAVKAEPMYPDFPNQVMAMDEAQLRMHQLCHYFSVYGLEELLGIRVKKGWLPEVERTEKTKQDERLLELKAVELFDEKEIYAEALRRILSRRSRIRAEGELEILMEGVWFVSNEELIQMKIPFKENLEILVDILVQQYNPENCITVMKELCQHTGDVFRCMYRVLKRKKYHLSTAEKRLFVKLLESFPEKDFRENLALSGKKSRQALNILRYLDYNRFSRSEGHRAAVQELRNGKLRSWEGEARRRIEEREETALDHVAQRPGMLLRMTGLFLDRGYSEQEVQEALCRHAEKLSTQTLVKLLSDCRHTYEGYASGSISLPDHFYGKYDRKILRLEKQYRRRIRKTETIRETEAKIGAVCQARKTGRRKYIRRMKYRSDHALSQLRNMFAQAGCRRVQDVLEKDLEALVLETSAFQTMLNRVKEAVGHRTDDTTNLKELTLQQIYDRFSEEKKKIVRIKYSQWMNAKKSREELEASQDEFRKQMDRICTERSRAYLEHMEKRDPKRSETMAAVDAGKRELLQERTAKRDAICEGYKEKCRRLDAMERIWLAALREKYSRVDTVLKGKKLYLDSGSVQWSQMKVPVVKNPMGGYDLSCSVWKIPEKAAAIRFFVYWNDSERVDLDLHALAYTGAYTIPIRDGLFQSIKPSHFRVGWDADMKKRGVLHSGDITHSDAAEYIDVQLTETEAGQAPIERVLLYVDLFTGKPNFANIEECHAGISVVSEVGQEEDRVLYDAANCFFRTDLRTKGRTVGLGEVDLTTRTVRYLGLAMESDEQVVGRIQQMTEMIDNDDPSVFGFSAEQYLTVLAEAQGAVFVDDPAEADLVLVCGKAVDEKQLSLIDNNFFLDL